MIRILKTGRLGNNLFQFAFGLSISKSKNIDFIFDTADLEEFFELNKYNSFLKKSWRYFKYLTSLKFRRWKTLDLDINALPQSILDLVEDHSIIYGYFQSENYFHDIQKDVREHFKIKEKHLKKYNSQYGYLHEQHTVCVAIRLTDYSTWKIEALGNITPDLTFDYFAQSISKIAEIENKKLIFISDDIDCVKLKMIYKNAIYIDNNIDSFIALTLSDELIVSNSSFHWWGAWLNKKKNKVVYAPKYWLGYKTKREYPLGIIPKDWVQLELNPNR